MDVFAGEAFSEGVKPIDADDFARNLAHKLAAAGVGCIAASAKNQSCDAGAIGAAVGEMVGDYLVEQGNESNLSAEDKRDILNRAKLVAGTVALAVGADVDTAANSAGVAVENNSLKQSDLDSLVREIGRLRRIGKEDEANLIIFHDITGKISKLAYQNWMDIEACYANPTNACLTKIRNDYSNVNFNVLKGREHIIEANGEIVTTVNGRSNAAHLNLVRQGQRRAATQEEINHIKSFVQ